jgi:hypothetical protein
MAERANRETVQSVLDIISQNLSSMRADTIAWAESWTSETRTWSEGYLNGYADVLALMQHALDKMED